MEETCVLLIWENYSGDFNVFKIPMNPDNEELINTLFKVKGHILGSLGLAEEVGEALADLSIDIGEGKLAEFKLTKEKLSSGFYCHSVIMCGAYS